MVPVLYRHSHLRSTTVLESTTPLLRATFVRTYAWMALTLPQTSRARSTRITRESSWNEGSANTMTVRSYMMPSSGTCFAVTVPCGV